MASSTATSVSRRREQGLRTRDRVLEVATDLMARRGYSGTTISAISKGSGVMPASIYWHFESKEGLLAAVIERAADAWFQGALHAVDQAQAAGDVEASRRVGFRYAFVDNPEFFRVLLLIALERRESDDLTLEAVRRIRERCRAFLTERLEERTELADAGLRRRVCERLATVGMVLLDGFFVAHQIDRTDPDTLAERFEAAMGLVRAAIFAQEGVPTAAGDAR